MDSAILGASVDAVGAIIAALLATAGVMIANSLRRQIMLRITERRLKAYVALWQEMEVASPMRLDPPDPKPLTRQERRRLYDNFTSWYFKKGNGMLLGQEASHCPF